MLKIFFTENKTFLKRNLAMTLHKNMNICLSQKVSLFFCKIVCIPTFPRFNCNQFIFLMNQQLPEYLVIEQASSMSTAFTKVKQNVMDGILQDSIHTLSFI